QGVGKHRVQCHVFSLHVIYGVITCGQIKETVRLIVEAVIRLDAGADVGALVLAKLPVQTAVVAVFKERRRDHGRWAGWRDKRRQQRCVSRYPAQLRKGGPPLSDARVLAMPLEREEGEALVLLDWPLYRATKPLAAVGML